jgi:hypothetical protein
MSMGTTAGVKELLGIPTATTGHDAAIANRLAEAERRINQMLKEHGVATPLATVPDELNDAANALAAGYFDEGQAALKSAMGRAGYSSPFTKRGLDMATAYITATYQGQGVGYGPKGRRGLFRRARRPYDDGGRFPEGERPL